MGKERFPVVREFWYFSAPIFLPTAIRAKCGAWSAPLDRISTRICPSAFEIFLPATFLPIGSEELVERWRVGKFSSGGQGGEGEQPDGVMPILERNPGFIQNVENSRYSHIDYRPDPVFPPRTFGVPQFQIPQSVESRICGTSSWCSRVPQIRDSADCRDRREVSCTPFWQRSPIVFFASNQSSASHANVVAAGPSVPLSRIDLTPTFRPNRKVARFSRRSGFRRFRTRPV